MSNFMPAAKEYSGPYRWDEAKERCVNDYKELDFVPTKNDGFSSETEEAEYWERLADMEIDQITY